MSNKLVYSTDKTTNEKSKAGNSEKPKPGKGPCKMRLESNGRAGKQVTVLFNLPFSDSEARELMRTLQSKFGCGATFKDGTIEFRGDLRPKLEDHFAKAGMKLVRAGG